MPLSNVFRHSFPNPFPNSSRKNRHAHARSGSTAGSPSSIVVVPVMEGKSGGNTVDFVTPLPPALGRSDSRKSINLKDKDKDKDTGKPRRKGSQATPKSAHSSLSDRRLERLDPDTIPRPSSPCSDLIPQLHISKALLPPSLQEQQQQHMSALSSPTSTSFSSSPLSPHIRMPTSPSAPSTPLVTNHSGSRLLFVSPEPLTPIVPTSPTSPLTSGTIGSRSRFGSLFSTNKTRQDSEERILSDPEVHTRVGKDKVDQALLKKKRLSTGSLQIPIGAFLSNTFRNKQQGTQQQQSQPEPLRPAQEQEQDQSQQQQQSPQRKKRRDLLLKLPKLDTRPRIIVSGSGSKKQKEAAKQVATGYIGSTQVPPENSIQDPDDAPGPDSDWVVVVPGPTETASSENGGGRHKSSTLKKAPPRLLSPFYLSRQMRTGASSHSSRNLDPNIRLPPPMGSTGEKNDFPTATGSQAGQQFADFYPAFKFEWHPDSQVFYDDRWDRASVRTVDTEIILLADDPNFPGYPERNDYWQQHCRIRERRWKHQIQKHQQQQMTEARSPKKWLNGGKADPATGLVEDDSGSLLEEDGEDDEGRTTDQDSPLADRLRGVTDLLNSLPERTTQHGRQSTAPQSSHQYRFRQRRVRYTTYSAYIAAMQVKSKNRTDHKRSLDVAAMVSPTAGSDTDKLMTDVRALRERAMIQPADVKETADNFEGVVMDSDPMGDPCLDPTRQSSLSKVYHGQRRYARHRDGTNLGSDDESEDQCEAKDRVHPMSSFASLQRHRQPDSGILFVATAPTTAEVYPTLVHDPREQPLEKSTKSATTGNRLIHGFSSDHDKNASTDYWIEGGYDEGMIGCLVASYFDKRVLAGRFGGKSGALDGGEGDDQSGGDKMVGNGFMMLQSSFGDQGSLDARNGPETDPYSSTSSRPPPNAVNNSNLNDKNNNNDINNNKNKNKNKNNYDNSNKDSRDSSSKKDLCLSRPGQYASHNHIMPLEKLLELEEQERQRRRRVLLEQQELDRQKKLRVEMEQQLQQLLIYPEGAALDATKPTSTITSTTSTVTLLPSFLSSSTSPVQPSPSFQPFDGAGGSNSSSSGGGDTFLAEPSTAASVSYAAASTHQPNDSEAASPDKPQTRQQRSGYMLLVLDRGRCQYYENGARKRRTQWDHYEEGGSENSYVGHDATEVIEEGVEEVDEEELAWMEQQRLRQETGPDLKRTPKGKGPVDGSSRVHPFGEPAVGGGGRSGDGKEKERVLSQEVDPLGSLAVIDSPLSPRFTNALSESPTVSATSSQVFSPPPSRPSTPSSANALASPRPQSMVVTSTTSSSHTNPPARQASISGLSALSRIRAAKSRASLSYSVLPTLSASSYASSNMLTSASEATSASVSTTTLLSSTPSTLLDNPSLGHRESGSTTPGSTLYSGGVTTPAAPSSPIATSEIGVAASGGKVHMSSSSSLAPFPGRKLPWSDVPNQLPTTTTPSATALLLNVLTKPPPPPPTIQGDGTFPPAGTGALSKNVKNDPAQRLKLRWDQKTRSQSVMFMSPSAMAARSRPMLLSPPPPATSAKTIDKKQQDQRQRRQGALSEGDLETEADQEMEEELRQLLDDTTHDNVQCQNKKAAAAAKARRTRRAMSMVELSVSTTASQYKTAVSATRQRFKAEASTSTSTVDILQSEGMYQ
ncbi:hypothetical protein BG015_010969 [Linnemannia schmuckeri]|uniref:Uncharacterized protein n=1 Tax=Linnemannia schmuckeri TaxID=64567 RepID=A0A9P5V8R0_9FUNG|nr:hypothetical protein BG015_010969 [Linnemannia schmuckeri]